jgi:hypothetical protein
MKSFIGGMLGIGRSGQHANKAIRATAIKGAKPVVSRRLADQLGGSNAQMPLQTLFKFDDMRFSKLLFGKKNVDKFLGQISADFANPVNDDFIQRMARKYGNPDDK